jgi:hypothetical protein
MRAVRLVDAVSSKNDLQRSHGFRAGGFPRVLRCLDWIGAADAICDDGSSGRTGFPQFQRGGGFTKTHETRVPQVIVRRFIMHLFGD